MFRRLHSVSRGYYHSPALKDVLIINSPYADQGGTFFLQLQNCTGTSSPLAHCQPVTETLKIVEGFLNHLTE